MERESAIFTVAPEGFRLAEVSVRLAKPQERLRWDALMDGHHYLGFKRFAGRGLRYVFEWRGHWIGLAGWQSGAFKCRPRDRWIGWSGKEQFRRLHLIGNNTRFLVLGAPGVFPNLASRALSAMTRRLSADWAAEHGTGMPLASLGFHDQNGERAAVRALLEEAPLAGRVITVDALHTVRDTARSIVESRGADYLMTVKGNAPETFATLAGIDWERDATGGYEEASAKAHGRIERRRIRTLTPLRGTVNYPHLKQIFRVERQRIDARSGHESRELAYGITSVPEERGSPEQLLAWNRGHWAVENQNHRTRDVHFAEDACLARKAHAPVNNALCNCIALAIILRRGKSVAEATRHFALHRNDALDAVLSPG